MDLGLIRKVDLDSEMQQSYLDYAMSVIVSRALPDARDGLKPVQRRILYSMYDMGLRPDASYKKSARIVGEVLGKYHPHGDMAVYEAMARLAQDFSMRYPLVDGQGNFGSIDGDPPAAMRYTEARLARPAMEMLNQIEKNTVDFSQNFDESLTEPVVLPAAIPNLLVNGATGIAVGMATNIPPHNLAEVVDALIYMLAEWDKLDDLTIEDLLRFIQGPDFPTGGVIIQEAEGEGLMGAYGSGRGRVVVQARAHLEEMVRGRNRIIVTELPYQVNKASLIERIAELVRDGVVEGIADLRDESDRQGMRIVIELAKTADPEGILRQLYKHTPMQTTFGIILLALVDNEPRLLSLKQALRVYLDHRLVVVKRRSEYDLEKARQRAHILEGLLIALRNLDEVISLIRNSPDAEQARLRLIKRFKLTEIQAQAILDLPLRRLASLERKKIEQEYKDISVQIKALEALLRSPKKMRQVVSDELNAMKEAYGDRRRTLIIRLKEGVSATSLLTTTDITPAQQAWIGMTFRGAIARTSAEQPLARIGKAAPGWLVHTNTHQTLYLAARDGRAAAIPAHAVPEIESSPEGVPAATISPLTADDTLAGLLALPDTAADTGEQYVLTVSRDGLIKKSPVAELPGPSAHTFVLAKINDGDELIRVQLTDGQSEIFVVTAKGMAIRFKEADVRPMGLVAAGVGAIKLAKDDAVIATEVVHGKGEIILIASNGKAKRVPVAEFPVQSRYGQGVQAWKLPAGVRLAAASLTVRGAGSLVHLARGESRLVKPGDISAGSRAVQGKALLGLSAGDDVIGLTSLLDGQGDEARAAKPAQRKATTPKAAAPKPTANGQPKAARKESSKPVKDDRARPTAARGRSEAAKPATAGSEVAGKTKPAETSKTKPAAVKKPTRPTIGQISMPMEPEKPKEKPGKGQSKPVKKAAETARKGSTARGKTRPEAKAAAANKPKRGAAGTPVQEILPLLEAEDKPKARVKKPATPPAKPAAKPAAGKTRGRK